MRKRKGISEIISVMIVLLIVSITGVILYNFSLETTSAQQDSLKYELDQGTAAAQERYRILGAIWIDQKEFNITLTVLNFGMIDIRLDEIYIDGVRTDYYLINNGVGDKIDVASLKNIRIISPINILKNNSYNIMIVTERGVSSAYLWKVPEI